MKKALRFLGEEEEEEEGEEGGNGDGSDNDYDYNYGSLDDSEPGCGGASKLMRVNTYEDICGDHHHFDGDRPDDDDDACNYDGGVSRTAGRQGAKGTPLLAARSEKKPSSTLEGPFRPVFEVPQKTPTEPLWKEAQWGGKQLKRLLTSAEVVCLLQVSTFASPPSSQSSSLLLSLSLLLLLSLYSLLSSLSF